MATLPSNRDPDLIHMKKRGAKGLFKETFANKESVGTIISDHEDSIRSAVSAIASHRRELEQYIHTHPEFLSSLKPVHVKNGPRIASLMAEPAARANVGPMAAVAGVLADLAVEDMLLMGARTAVVENGGEAALMSDRPIHVALSAGDSPLSKRVGFRVTDFPQGLATSSGLYSHALSFGEADSVTVFAGTAGLADAAATTVGNTVKGSDIQDSINRGIDRAMSIEGVVGVFIMFRDKVGIGGDVPPFLRVDVKEEHGVLSQSTVIHRAAASKSAGSVTA
jgi:ApbE superfamily uncharacterized protein (UPF0280 family)